MIRQRRYQAAHRKAGLCYVCPAPVGILAVLDGESRAVIDERPSKLCPKHLLRLRAQKRRKRGR